MVCSGGNANTPAAIPPYFVSNLIVFFGLQTASRCKIFKTNKLFAK
jgi:hypothetical protein